MYFNKNSSAKELSSTPLMKSFFYKNDKNKIKPTMRFYRWGSVIFLQSLFFLSFYIDIQILEGTLNASRLLGFHLIDIFTTIEVFVATYQMPTNLLIGTISIGIFYLLVGGRSYCSWVCPYGLLSEISESLHVSLVNKKIIKEKKFNHKLKYIFFVIFLLASYFTHLLIFESFNVVGILSRFIVYGGSVGLVWVVLVFLFDVVYSKRAWCSYICPVGTSYSFLGFLSATKVQWNDNCDHCMACHMVCPESHVLELTKQKYDEKRNKLGIKNEYIISGDCTLCGRCMDVCHQDALKYDLRLTKLL